MNGNNWTAPGDGKNRTDARKSKEKMLLVLGDPAHLGKSVEQKAKIAGVSKTTFYALLRDPRFRDELKAARDAALSLKVDKLIEASYEVATTAGPRGFGDRKLLLEMAGQYYPGGRGAPTEQGMSQAELAAKSDEELIDLCQELGIALPPELQMRIDEERRREEERRQARLGGGTGSSPK